MWKNHTTKRTTELEDLILSGLSAGEPLTQVCARNGLHYTSWREWCRADPDLEIAHGIARDLGHDAIADRLRKTARGKAEADGGDSSGDVQRDKLIVETDLKLLAKWDPRRYGERIQQELSGAVETKLDLTALSTDQLRALASIKIPAQ